jgi:arylsulfatase A-like enzyme
MPLIARWVGHIPAGRVSAIELMSADWLPTVASLAGASLLPAPDSSSLMGADRAAAFVPSRGSLPPRKTPVMWDYRADGYGKQSYLTAGKRF